MGTIPDGDIMLVFGENVKAKPGHYGYYITQKDTQCLLFPTHKEA